MSYDRLSQVFHKLPKIMKPLSNWHRMLHLLDLNGGTLYKAQIYVSKSYRDHVKMRDVIRPDHQIKTDGMPKMTNTAATKPSSYAYEERGHRLGLVSIQRYNNRKYITLLPKGRDILNRFFRQDLNWTVQ